MNPWTGRTELASIPRRVAQRQNQCEMRHIAVDEEVMLNAKHLAPECRGAKRPSGKPWTPSLYRNVMTLTCIFLFFFGRFAALRFLLARRDLPLPRRRGVGFVGRTRYRAIVQGRILTGRKPR